MSIKVGDKVKFINPLPDEIGLIMRVIELRGERLLVESLVGMTINPTNNVLLSEVEVIK